MKHILEKSFMKVKMANKLKMNLNLLEKINFYQCELAAAQNMKNIRNLGVLKIPAQ